MLVQMRQETARFLETFLLVQAVLTSPESSATAVRSAFTNYRKALLPYVEQEQRREEEDIHKALVAERQRGPLVVTEHAAPSFRSQLREALRRRWRR